MDQRLDVLENHNCGREDLLGAPMLWRIFELLGTWSWFYLLTLLSCLSFRPMHVLGQLVRCKFIADLSPLPFKYLGLKQFMHLNVCWPLPPQGICLNLIFMWRTMLPSTESISLTKVFWDDCGFNFEISSSTWTSSHSHSLGLFSCVFKWFFFMNVLVEFCCSKFYAIGVETMLMTLTVAWIYLAFYPSLPEAEDSFHSHARVNA